MKIKVSDLNNKQLDEWVARAQGWELVFPNDNLFRAWQKSDNKCDTVSINGYSPTSDTQAGKAQVYDLQLKFEVDVNKLRSSDEWCARVFPRKGIDAIADTPAIAVCRAIVTSIYGEYVEVE